LSCAVTSKTLAVTRHYC